MSTKKYRKKLRNWRKSEGLTLSQAAERCNMTLGNYFKIEVPGNRSGVRRLIAPTIDKLINGTGLSYSDLEADWKGPVRDKVVAE